MPQSGKLYQVIFYEDLMLDDDNLLIEADIDCLLFKRERRRERIGVCAFTPWAHTP